MRNELEQEIRLRAIGAEPPQKKPFAWEDALREHHNEYIKRHDDMRERQSRFTPKRTNQELADYETERALDREAEAVDSCKRFKANTMQDGLAAIRESYEGQEQSSESPDNAPEEGMIIVDAHMAMACVTSDSVCDDDDTPSLVGSVSDDDHDDEDDTSSLGDSDKDSVDEDEETPSLVDSDMESVLDDEADAEEEAVIESLPGSNIQETTPVVPSQQTEDEAFDALFGSDSDESKDEAPAQAVQEAGTQEGQGRPWRLLLDIPVIRVEHAYTPLLPILPVNMRWT